MRVAGGRPRGGWPATVVRGVRCQALSLPRPPVLWSGQPGFCDPCVPGAVGGGVGTQHRPHGARPCGPALRAVGVAEGRSRGGVRSAVVRGVWGQALPLPRLPALWAGCRGPLPTGCGCGGVRAWRPVTNPTARAVASWLCALWGRHEGAPGVRLLPGCGASGAGRSPIPDCPPSGRAAGAHYPLAVGAGGCGRGDPSPTPQSALLQAGFARCGGGTRAPGGGASCLLVGRPGSGALPPRLPTLWAGCGGPLATGCGCGGVRAWGPVTNPTARALACCGGGMRMPGGGGTCLGVGHPGSGALRPPTARPLCGLPGPTTHWLWVRGGAGVGTRHQPPSSLFCELALLAVGAA